MIKEFKINVLEEQISNINNKIKNYPWKSIEDMEGWIHGTNKIYLKEICEYWVSEFDWKKHEKLINSYSNFKTNIEGVDIHFIKEEGSGKNPKPLLLMHGWPGSIVEFLEIIKPLAHPEEFGGNITNSLSEAVKETDIIFTMLTDDDAVEKVLGNSQFLDNLKPSSTVIDMLSIKPKIAIKYGNLLKQKNINFLDAPVSGGTIGAEEGSLAIMVGGEQKVFDNAFEVLKIMGNPTLVGPIGSGQVSKLANQIIVGVTIGAVAEASATAPIVTPTIIWFASFETCPLPIGPTKVGFPIIFKTSKALSKTFCSPPTMIARLPSSAPIVPPETGASRKLIFFCFNKFPYFIAILGFIDNMSMTVEDGFKLSRN